MTDLSDSIVKVGDKLADIEKAFPMTIGDIRFMSKIGLMLPGGSMPAVDQMPMDKMCDFISHLVRKANPQITEAEAETIDIDTMNKVGSFLGARMAAQSEKAVDPITSGASTSAPAASVGDQEISKA
jgi:hypothetical protein